VELGVVALEAKVRIHAIDRRRTEFAPAVVIDVLERDVSTDIPALHAGLRRLLDASERTGAKVEFGSVIVEPILHIEADRPAERIQSEHRIARHDGDVVDRDVG
jgi:hypothetical protein